MVQRKRPSESNPIASVPADWTAAGEVTTPAQPRDSAEHVLELTGVTKFYGDTTALGDVDLVAQGGEVLSLLGPNGAGKSTLLKIVAGTVVPTAGQLSICGEPVDLSAYDPREAYRRGIYTVYQELSLFSNLSVAENFALSRSSKRHRSRRQNAAAAAEAIAEVFPGARIAPNAEVSSLSLADRQAVEIVLAASQPDLTLLILDEPTSSLPAERASQLHDYLVRRKEAGVAVIYVTHKLDDALQVSDRLAVLRDGRLHWEGHPRATTRAELLLTLGAARMGGAPETPSAPAVPTPDRERRDARDNRVLEFRGARGRGGSEGVIVVVSGEVVGLAGLEGAGQRSLLRAVFAAATSRRPRSTKVRGGVAYISGDRQSEGLFPLWNIAENIIVSTLPRVSRLGVVRLRAARRLATDWFKTLRIAARDPTVSVGDLSGGTQQKVIVARGLASEAALLLLDDPTRGVDVPTKQEVYDLLRRLRSEGRSALWYSTEDREFAECDRVYVMANGAVVKELTGPDISREQIIHWSYAHVAGSRHAAEREAVPQGDEITIPAASALPGRLRAAGVGSRLALAAVFFVGVVTWTVIAEPSSMTTLGMDLLLSGVVPLVLASLAQMFIILAGGIDVGVGYAVGLANVVCATTLFSHVGLGALFLCAIVGGYVLMAVIVELARVPAVVVTLGASFVWLGLGLELQATPGGNVPGWLAKSLDGSLPVVPEPVYLILGLAIAMFVLLRRSHGGAVLRAFGNNRLSFANTGRSPLGSMIMLYVLAGVCVVLAGSMVTVVNTASDINASSTLTLASIAAVVVGGAEFVGGFVEPVGTILAAVALGLLASLMAFVSVPTDYVWAVEGGMLIAAMAVRWFGRQTVRYRQ